MNHFVKLLAAAAVGAAFLISGCAGGKPQVHVMKAALSREPLTIETKAVPEALHTAPVIPNVSGGLVSNPPDIGTVVNAGDVLFEIDSSQYQSQAASLQAQIAAASQRSAPARSSASYGAPVDDSLEASLLKQGIITRAEYNRIKGRSAPAPAPQQTESSGGEAPEALINSYQAVQRLIAGCTVRAPISGVVSQVYLGDSHMAMAGKPALVIRQDSPVTANVEIPSKLDNVLEKAKDEKSLTVSMSDGSNVWYGELKPPAEGQQSAIGVYKVQVDNPNDEITIGNEYNIRIESGQNVDAFMIPKSALIGEDTVAVVNENHLVDMKTVSVASESGGYLLIMDGLSEGDEVITDPPEKLEMGMEVDAKSE